MLFTTASDDVLVVEGHMSRFWRAVRDRYGDQVYFSWLELQRRGAAHYHAMWVDPPLHDNRGTKQWLEGTWGLGFVKVTRKRRGWFAKRAGEYVKRDDKKWGGNAYQQDYRTVPRNIRTFQCSRLGWPGAELDQHRTRQLAEWVPAHVSLGDLVPEHVIVWGQLVHRVHSSCSIGSPRARASPRRGSRQSYVKTHRHAAS